MKKIEIKDIIKNKEAKVVPIIAIVIVVILIVAGIAIYFYYVSGSDNYWETKNEFGSWGQEILLEFDDHSVKSVKSLADNEILNVYYAGEKIIGYQYKLKGKASGSGWDSVEVDTNNYVITVNSKDDSGNVYHSHAHSFTAVNSFAVDSQWHSVCSVSGGITNVFPDTMSPGIYTMTFVPSGSLKYIGSPGGNWETGTLPASVSLRVEVQSDQGVLSVTFTGEASTF